MYPSRQQKQTNKHVNVHQRKLMIHLYNKNIIIKKKANEAAQDRVLNLGQQRLLLV